MRSHYLTSYSTLRTEGAILPRDIIQRIADGDSSLGGLSPESYHLGKTEKINEATNRAWNRLVGAWVGFRQAREKLSATDVGTKATREQWLLPLFQELGYGRLLVSKKLEMDGREYAISHLWQHAPIHLVGCRVDLDKRTSGVAGAARISPHGLVQELLNRSEGYLWGFVSNGLVLRILRDNKSLTRQAYIEFDLEAMMEGEAYSDFVLLWLLCHQSRVEADKPEDCWLEKWSKAAQEQGIRALEHLRDSVQNAIGILGAGFLSHPRNTALRHRLQDPGGLDKQDYYRQLLRLVYRLLFLLVAEDRELLLDPKADSKAKELYVNFYSISRLRTIAEKLRGTRHSDLYEVLKLVMRKLGSKGGCQELGLPALGSDLFSSSKLADLEAADLSNSDLLEAIRTLTLTVEGRVRRTIDYKNLQTIEFGSVYESLLEMHPDINADSGRFELRVAAGHERKTTGSYYTPESLVQCLLDSALDPVLQEAANKPNPEEAILKLKVCDPACGSGHFLIAAAHRMAKRLAAVRTGDDEPSPEATRTALRDVIGRCIYGVDINPDAVELCKVALWIEELEPGKPLSFLQHHIQCGNSLLGTTPALLKKGIPDEAFTPIEGDDKEVCKDYKKRNKKERETAQESLLTAEGLPWQSLGNLAASVLNLDQVSDKKIEGIDQKQKLYEDLVKSSGYLYNRFWADTWCAAFVWKKTKEFPYPITEEVFRRIERSPHSVDTWLRDEVIRLRDQYKFFQWHLAFPDVFTLPAKSEQSENEQTGWNGGFNIVLGNPPWEMKEFNDREFFSGIRDDIATGDLKKRQSLIKALKVEDSSLHDRYVAAYRRSSSERQLMQLGGVFPLTSYGRVNSYALFAELSVSIVGKQGRVGIIVPSGIGSDTYNQKFFDTISGQSRLGSFYDFENSRGIFQGVHRSFKFCLLTMGISKHTSFSFFLRDVSELTVADRQYRLSVEELATINPNTRSVPVFRTFRDVGLTIDIHRRLPVLRRTDASSNSWDARVMRMFSLSDGDGLFERFNDLTGRGALRSGVMLVTGDNRYAPLYSGKYIYHFNHRYAIFEANDVRDSTIQELSNPDFVVTTDYWVSEENLKYRVGDKTDKQWLLCYRDTTNVTNERTCIAAIIPIAANDTTCRTIYLGNGESAAACLLSNLNSFALDYVARQKVGGSHLTATVAYQLPVIAREIYDSTVAWRSAETEVLREWVQIRALELTYTSRDITPFAKDCGYDGPPFRWDEERRFLIRCELDAAFFHLYGIARDDVDYIMDTFPIVRKNDEKKHGEYRTKRVILEVYDAIADAVRTGHPYQTIVNPPPGDPSVAHPATTESQTVRS